MNFRENGRVKSISRSFQFWPLQPFRENGRLVDSHLGVIFFEIFAFPPDHKDEAGNVIFKDTGVHQGISMMTQRLIYPGKTEPNKKVFA